MHYRPLPPGTAPYAYYTEQYTELGAPHSGIWYVATAARGREVVEVTVYQRRATAGGAPTAGIVLGAVARLCGLRIIILMRILKDELILAFSTASSESVLPRIIEKMEAYGAPASITSFVVPTGYSFNLDGSTLYQSIAAIFIAQLYGIELSLWQEIVLVLTLMVTSKGIAGVPGVSFVVLLATLGSVGIPLEGLAFIAGVDRILDMARTALNVVGNALAVLVIAKWEHKFDHKKARAYERELLG